MLKSFDPFMSIKVHWCELISFRWRVISAVNVNTCLELKWYSYAAAAAEKERERRRERVRERER